SHPGARFTLAPAGTSLSASRLRNRRIRMHRWWHSGRFGAFGRLARRSGSGRCFSDFRPLLEALEDRSVPTTNTWVNPAGGNWAAATNWSLGHVPTSSEIAVIPDIGTAEAADQTITFTGTGTVAGLESGETVSVTSGTLTVNGSLTNSATSN